jgi:hypothetical protein
MASPLSTTSGCASPASALPLSGVAGCANPDGFSLVSHTDDASDTLFAYKTFAFIIFVT